MTTANDIILRAHREIGVLGEGEILTSLMASDGLIYLNDLIESLGNEHLMIYQDTKEVITMDGSTSYTWGVDGDITTTRPLRIVNAFFRINTATVDYPVSVLTNDEYDAITSKSDTGAEVDYIFLKTSYPLAELFVYPVPTNGDLHLTSWKPLDALALGTTSLAFPNGYERMFRLNLDVELMSLYNIQGRADLVQRAFKAKGDIKRVNSKPRIASINVPIGGYYNNRANIIRGY